MVERSAVDSSNGTQLCRRHAHSHAFLAEAHRGMPSWLSTGRSSLRRTWTRARRQSRASAARNTQQTDRAGQLRG